MARAELWAALREAADAVRAAVDDCAREETPQARAALDAAFTEYVQRLYPVIGQAEAFRYEVSLATYQEAIERVVYVDATDGALVQQLVEEQAAAGKVFEGARVALAAALERALAHDHEPDEKGGA